MTTMMVSGAPLTINFALAGIKEISTSGSQHIGTCCSLTNRIQKRTTFGNLRRFIRRCLNCGLRAIICRRAKVRSRLNNPWLQEKFAPTVKPHAFGCKRISLENGFYELFNQDNASSLHSPFSIALPSVQLTVVSTSVGPFSRCQ